MMKTRTGGSPASPSQRLPALLFPSCIFTADLKPGSPARTKSRGARDSPTSSSTELDEERFSDSNFPSLQSLRSPRQALKRLANSVFKNSVKLRATFTSRKFSSSSFISLPRSDASFEDVKDEEMVRELSAVFRHFDSDRDGKISWEELRTALNSIGEEVGENELREIIKELRSDGAEYINMQDFIRLNMEERGAEQAEKELVAAFRMFEGEGGRSGGITPAGLHRMMSRLGVRNGGHALSFQNCNFIISQVDLDGDGVVNFEEFKRMMTAVVQ